MEPDIEARFWEPLFTLSQNPTYQMLNYKTLDSHECILSVLVRKSLFNSWFPNLDNSSCQYKFTRRNDYEPVTQWFRIINIVTSPTQITNALIQLCVSIFINTIKSIIYSDCSGHIGAKDSSKIKRRNLKVLCKQHHGATKVSSPVSHQPSGTNT